MPHVLALGLLFAAAAPLPPDVPVVRVSLADGWLTLTLTRGGRPVPGAAARCLVGARVWAEGTTDATGEGAFPRPPGHDCQLVFDLGAGPSAPVPLSFPPAGGVVPDASPVLDGTAACCKIPRPPAGPVVPAEVTPSWSQWGAAAAAAVLVAAVVGAAGWWVLVSFRSASRRRFR